MSTVNRILVAWLAVLMLLLGGCKKSVEGEQQAWKTNTEQVKGLVATYPGFKAPLEARLTKAGEVVHPTRVAVTGRTVGPGLFETIHVLGRERALGRLRNARDQFTS